MFVLFCINKEMSTAREQLSYAVMFFCTALVMAALFKVQSVLETLSLKLSSTEEQVGKVSQSVADVFIYCSCNAPRPKIKTGGEK
jgi:hypothetical protein